MLEYWMTSTTVALTVQRHTVEMRFLEVINGCALEKLLKESTRGEVILDLVLSRA